MLKPIPLAPGFLAAGFPPPNENEILPGVPILQHRWSSPILLHFPRICI